MTFSKNMEQIFDVEPTIIHDDASDVVDATYDVATTNLNDTLEIDLASDYENSRKNFQTLIEKGQEAISDILKIARESEHPRAFEVAATLIKNVSEVNRELIDLQKRMKDIEKIKNGGKQPPVNVDKAIFVGSTSELNKLLKGKLEENQE